MLSTRSTTPPQVALSSLLTHEWIARFFTTTQCILSIVFAKHVNDRLRRVRRSIGILPFVLGKSLAVKTFVCVAETVHRTIAPELHLALLIDVVEPSWVDIPLWDSNGPYVGSHPWRWLYKPGIPMTYMPTW